MAKPKTELPDAETLRVLADEKGRLSVRVTPAARSESVIVDSGRVLVKVRAKPQDGAANAAVIALLATALGCAPSHLKVLRGATSREKLVQID